MVIGRNEDLAICFGQEWCLDTTLGEYSDRVRKDNSPLNLNVMRKLSLSLLKFSNMDKRVSLKKKMFKAALNQDHLLAVLTQM